jgi:hypothetical protein
MILLLVAVTWILVLSLVMAMCAAARGGDRERLARASASVAAGREERLASHPAEDLELTAPTKLRAAEPGASLRLHDGVAA